MSVALLFLILGRGLWVDFRFIFVICELVCFADFLRGCELACSVGCFSSSVFLCFSVCCCWVLYLCILLLLLVLDFG